MRQEERRKGQLYDERKGNVIFSLTPTATTLLDKLAEELGIQSRSELVEQIGRGIIPLGEDSARSAFLGKLLAI